MQPDDPSADQPVQLPLWAEEPPEEAGPLLDAIDRLRLQRQLWERASTFRDATAISGVRAQLQRAAVRIEARFELSTSGLPASYEKAYERVFAAVLPLIPATPEELAELEQTVEVASTDPESRKLVARIADRLPSRDQVGKATMWAALVMVALDLLKIAPELNPNDIGVLTMILMVVLYLLPPRSGS